MNPYDRSNPYHSAFTFRATHNMKRLALIWVGFPVALVACWLTGWALWTVIMAVTR